jgi:hypothetical protein
MTIQEITRLKQEKPFRPFRILTADGRSYDVVHPECLAQSVSGRLILLALPDDSTVTLDLLLVAGIRRGIRPARNGSKKRN